MIQLCRVQTLTVSAVDSRGVWLDAGDRGARLPLREAPEAVPGDLLDVFVYLDAVGNLQATLRTPAAQEGEIAMLRVRSVSPHGAFLDWGMPKDLLAPFSLQPERMQVGRPYLVKVCLDGQGRPYADGRVDEFLDRCVSGLTEGEEVDLVVWQLTDLGAKVVVNERFPGLLYRDDLPEGVAPGMRLSGYVKRVRDDGKLDVTTRKVGAEGVAEARDAIMAALRAGNGFLPVGDSSPPEEIRTKLGMSKKTFKKAVGGLYRDGIVALENGGVRLRG